MPMVRHRTISSLAGGGRKCGCVCRVDAWPDRVLPDQREGAGVVRDSTSMRRRHAVERSREDQVVEGNGRISRYVWDLSLSNAQSQRLAAPGRKATPPKGRHSLPRAAGHSGVEHVGRRYHQIATRISWWPCARDLNGREWDTSGRSLVDTPGISLGPTPDSIARRLGRYYHKACRRFL
jgi:hypothetical protein